MNHIIDAIKQKKSVIYISVLLLRGIGSVNEIEKSTGHTPLLCVLTRMAQDAKVSTQSEISQNDLYIVEALLSRIEFSKISHKDKNGMTAKDLVQDINHPSLNNLLNIYTNGNKIFSKEYLSAFDNDYCYLEVEKVMDFEKKVNIEEGNLHDNYIANDDIPASGENGLEQDDNF